MQGDDNRWTDFSMDILFSKKILQEVFRSYGVKDSLD
jgi:hypothetical protein